MAAFAPFPYSESMNIWKGMLKTLLVHFIEWLSSLDKENSKTRLPRIFHRLWNSDLLLGTLSCSFMNIDGIS